MARARRSPVKVRGSSQGARRAGLARGLPLDAPIDVRDLGSAGDLGALAHYADPAYYRLTYDRRRDDVSFYVAACREFGGPVLEYGAGNGRIALRLAEAGLSVTGVDLSRPMLADFRKRLREQPSELRRRVSVRHGDMRTLKLGKRFATVIAPFNVVLHLYSRADLSAFLQRVRQHCLPGAHLVFDFSLPEPADLALDPQRRFRAPRFKDPETGAWVRYQERFEYDPIRQILAVWMEFFPATGAPYQVPLTHRQYFPQELLGAVEAAGFRDAQLSQDFSWQPATAQADSLVLCCRAPLR